MGKESEYTDTVIDKVISADTIKLKNGKRIKLIGLKAPQPPKLKENIERDQFGFEVKLEPALDTPIEEQAFFWAKEFLEGKRVRIEFDADQSLDKSSNTPGYVFLIKDNVFANEEILKQGFADLHIRPPNTKYEEKFRAAYQEARQEKRGLHNL